MKSSVAFVNSPRLISILRRSYNGDLSQLERLDGRDAHGRSCESQEVGEVIEKCKVTTTKKATALFLRKQDLLWGFHACQNGKSFLFDDSSMVNGPLLAFAPEHAIQLKE